MKIYKYLILITLSLLLFTNFSLAQIGFSARVDSLQNLIFSSTLNKLDREISGDTSTMIGGAPYTIVSRHYANASNAKAAQFIYEKFLSFGLSARYMNNSSTSVNVIGKKTGYKYPNKYFIISSHYDDMPSGSTAPGADDNGSGTCGVIEAARIISTLNLPYTVVFITFDEEERGLYGSYAYVDSAYAHGDSIMGVVNLDMIAYDGNNDGKCFVVHNNPSSLFADDFISAMKYYQPTLNPIKTYDLTANSDHAPFWTKNWNAFLLIEDENDFTPFYHTVNDKYSSLNLSYFLKMAKASLAGVISYAGDYRMSFTHVPLNTGNFTNARVATAVIKSGNGIATGTNAPRLYYKINNGSFSYVNPSYTNLDTFKFTIPAQVLGTTVSYYFAAQDPQANFVCTYPAGGKGLNPPGSVPPSDVFTYTVANVTFVNVGNGNTAVGYPYYTYYMDSRTDMLYTPAEIQAAGGSAGTIAKIGFDVTSFSSQMMNGFNIKMQNYINSTIFGFENNYWTTVYSGTYQVTGTGWQYIELNTPFFYDGASSLLVEICFNNSSYTTNTTVNGTTVANTIVHNHQDISSGDGCVQITTPGSVTAKPNISLMYTNILSAHNNQTGMPKDYSLSQNY
ncbi:MAG TPA: M28 family peptidase, partial [Ignavibacteria bacterium]|nr:M28 family peptidase [Ignavibacteria bacterium]